MSHSRTSHSSLHDPLMNIAQLHVIHKTRQVAQRHSIMIQILAFGLYKILKMERNSSLNETKQLYIAFHVIGTTTTDYKGSNEYDLLR